MCQGRQNVSRRESSEARAFWPQVKNPWRTIFSRRYVPELMTALWIPIFQQLTGDSSRLP